MSYLLDANLVSEFVKPRRDAGVEAFIAARRPAELHLSAVTLGEIRLGVQLMPSGARQRMLEVWLSSTIPATFAGRILAVDGEIAEAWGRMAASERRAGRALDVIDGLIAATAVRHGLTVVTRNVRHFQPLGVSVLDPWTDRG